MPLHAVQLNCCLWLLWLLQCRTVMAQSPIEQLQLGAMTVAGNIAEAVQQGGALRKDVGFDTPIMSAHSRTAIGTGNAMRKGNDDDDNDDDDESDEARKRKRRELRQLQRTKRAPCHTGSGAGGTGNSGTGTGNPADYEDEIEQRRRGRRRAKARQRVTKQRKRTSGKKKSIAPADWLIVRRLRRQVGSAEDALQGGQNAVSKIGEQLSENARRIAENWQNFIGTMTQVVQQVKQSIGQKKQKI